MTLNGDMLVVGADESTYFFSLKHGGYFEESFSLMNETFDMLQLSGRQAVAVLGDQVYSLNLEDCSQLMPTETPSFSAMPTYKPSESSMPSTHVPTKSNLPTRSTVPSRHPSKSLIPSVSTVPSQNPTTTSSPTACYDVVVAFKSDGLLGGFPGDVISWELFNKQTGEVILQADSVPKNETFWESQPVRGYEAKCLGRGDFVFRITNNAGNGGFGECSSCESFVFVNGEYVGWVREFFHEVKATFTLGGDTECRFYGLSKAYRNDFFLGRERQFMYPFCTFD